MVILSMLAFIIAFIFLMDFVYTKFFDKNLEMQIHFNEKTAFEGESASLSEVVINRKWLPLPWLAVKFQASKHFSFYDDIGNYTDNYYRNDVFSIMPYQKVTRRLAFTCNKRGYYSIQNISLSSSNIFINKTLASVFQNQTSITVYPCLINSHDFDFELKRIAGNVTAQRFIDPDPFLFKGIREYQPFDDFKQINFKATAKMSQLMVNVNDFTISKEVVILLNLEPYNAYPDMFIFEQSIRMAATFAEHFITNEGIPVKLISGSRDILTQNTIDTESGESTHHLFQIYDALARIDLDQKVVPIKEYLYDDIENQKCTDTIYILVSPYHEKDLQDIFYHVQNDFSNIYWIVPKPYNIRMNVTPSENIIFWEAETNEL